MRMPLMLGRSVREGTERAMPTGAETRIRLHPAVSQKCSGQRRPAVSQGEQHQLAAGGGEAASSSSSSSELAKLEAKRLGGFRR